ncbi:hypothetical protein ADL28_42210 [Streptomyces violaceusniger]|uniref:Uncharacterized protein n=1 Tax=Streptomyces violaceusniger TaxID=68280 RepID=A0A0X3VHM6_STRVO|nr:hypothetical protein ADL28_42210 [Streptomyces violaceusniger]
MDEVFGTHTPGQSIPTRLAAAGTAAGAAAVRRGTVSAAAASSGEMVHAHIERPPLHSGGRR